MAFDFLQDDGGIGVLPPELAGMSKAVTPGSAAPELVDGFGRCISYLRLSVTDHCNLRCFYCMSKKVTFLPRSDVLSLNELYRVAEAFIDLGVRSVRLTGGEPLMRRDLSWLVERLGRQVALGRLDEITLTTNGTELAAHARTLHALGVRRVNVSLDTLDPELFRRITRHGELSRVLAGIDAALSAGLAVKINTVALKGVNDGGFDDLLAWCGQAGADMTLIETMPLGNLPQDGADLYLPLSEVRRDLGERWTLLPSRHRTSGPADYVDVGETGRRLGFVAALSHRFCGSCNRVRVTCTGTLYTCLGQGENGADLKAALRKGTDSGPLLRAIQVAMATKPGGHRFAPGAGGSVGRHMNLTGG